jgi:hypothetical protein
MRWVEARHGPLIWKPRLLLMNRYLWPLRNWMWPNQDHVDIRPPDLVDSFMRFPSHLVRMNFPSCGPYLKYKEDIAYMFIAIEGVIRSRKQTTKLQGVRGCKKHWFWGSCLFVYRSSENSSLQIGLTSKKLHQTILATSSNRLRVTGNTWKQGVSLVRAGLESGIWKKFECCLMFHHRREVN